MFPRKVSFLLPIIQRLSILSNQYGSNIMCAGIHVLTDGLVHHVERNVAKRFDNLLIDQLPVTFELAITFQDTLAT